MIYSFLRAILTIIPKETTVSPFEEFRPWLLLAACHPQTYTLNPTSLDLSYPATHKIPEICLDPTRVALNMLSLRFWVLGYSQN